MLKKIDLSPRRLISAFVVFNIKCLSHIFYRTEMRWISSASDDPWKNVKLFVFINHTSLYEVLFFSSFPFHFLWKGSSKVVIPGADKTMNRPIVGQFFKFLTPKTVSISRKRDQTWSRFLHQIDPESIVVIVPEGRMMRPNGLDLKGEPMSIRGGIADILQMVSGGEMIIGYSGGLHHIQTPGQFFPRIFKKIKINYESVLVDDYKKQFKLDDPAQFKAQVIQDLERRKKNHCPK